MNAVVITGLNALLLLTWSGSASAYLDPGTGSVLLQAIIATVAAGFASIGIFWHKMKGLIQWRKRSGASQDRDAPKS